ncbi:MAG: hypothetical protein ACOVOT_13105 [Rubrivivax sp.]|jgi:hypothetical protein|nr:hypothetical protein [Rubrivivax sp.]
MSVTPCELPAGALLQRHCAEGAFTDSYRSTVPGRIVLADFVAAFYTTPLFKLERAVLALAGAPSTDDDARALGEGRGERFAVWRVEARAEGQLLLVERTGRTRLWLMVEPDAAGRETVLRFGSALLPRGDRAIGERRSGRLFTALLGLHDRYSRALLAAAARRLRTGSAP